MIAAVYARKSTDQNGVADEERSVTRQVENARAYAESKGWTVADERVYVDDGTEGVHHPPQVVQKLLTEKLTFAPEERDGREGFRFSATGTVEKLVAGLVPGLVHGGVSPTGMDPMYFPVEGWLATARRVA